MAIFSKKEKTETKAATKAVKKDAVVPVASSAILRDLSHVLLHARITEKATMHSADGVYTFDIGTNASKRDVIQAVQAVYKVVPRKVHVVKVPTKTRRNPRTGKVGVTRGGRKAYVYLKKGETITIG